MANYCVAWFLLVSHLVLLGLSGFGIGLAVYNFGDPVKPPPIPPAVNETDTSTTTTTADPYNYHYNYRNGKEPSQEFKDFVSATQEYSSYDNDPRLFVVLPCGVCALTSALVILSGICSRKNFSKTTGLYSSFAMWILTLVYAIIFQYSYPWNLHNETSWNAFSWILGMQISTLIILTIQMIMAVWELRRQKVGWPVLHFSHLFTLNTIFLVTRITVSAYTLDSFLDWQGWRGLVNTKYRDMYDNFGYWNLPTIRYPEYFVYPVATAILFGITTSLEGVLSHLIGYGHARMLWISGFLSALFYSGVVVLSSPAFILRFSGSRSHGELMAWSLGAMFTCLVHAVACLAKPIAMSSPPSIVVAAQGQLQMQAAELSNTERLMNSAAAIRSRFKGSDTLLFNTFVLILNGLSILLICLDFGWSWGYAVLLCGNVAMVNRILPLVIMEALTQKVDNVPVFKMLIHFLLECVLLVVGSIAMINWFYGRIVVTILVNACLVAMQLYKLVRNPALKSAMANLANKEEEGPTNTRLMSEPEDGMDSSLDNNDENHESGRIYQPLA